MGESVWRRRATRYTKARSFTRRTLRPHKDRLEHASPEMFSALDFSSSPYASEPAARNPCSSSCRGSRSDWPLDQHLVHEAPAPIFSWFEGLHYGVPGRAGVQCGMFVLTGVATAYMPAGQAHSQVNPRVARPQALLAPLGARLHVLYLVQV